MLVDSSNQRDLLIKSHLIDYLTIKFFKNCKLHPSYAIRNHTWFSVSLKRILGSIFILDTAFE